MLLIGSPGHTLRIIYYSITDGDCKYGVFFIIYKPTIYNSFLDPEPEENIGNKLSLLMLLVPDSASARGYATTARPYGTAIGGGIDFYINPSC